jgi:hypothetical protein
MHYCTFRRIAALECGMGKLIYLDHYRLQEPDLPPNSCCGGLVRPYVVDPSVPPTMRPVIHRWKNWQDRESDAEACYVLRGYFGLKIKPSPMGQRVSDDWESNTSSWD